MLFKIATLLSALSLAAVAVGATFTVYDETNAQTVLSVSSADSPDGHLSVWDGVEYVDLLGVVEAQNNKIEQLQSWMQYMRDNCPCAQTPAPTPMPPPTPCYAPYYRPPTSGRSSFCINWGPNDGAIESEVVEYHAKSNTWFYGLSNTQGLVSKQTAFQSGFATTPNQIPTRFVNHIAYAPTANVFIACDEETGTTPCETANMWAYTMDENGTASAGSKVTWDPPASEKQCFLWGATDDEFFCLEVFTNTIHHYSLSASGVLTWQRAVTLTGTTLLTDGEVRTPLFGFDGTQYVMSSDRLCGGNGVLRFDSCGRYLGTSIAGEEFLISGPFAHGFSSFNYQWSTGLYTMANHCGQAGQIGDYFSEYNLYLAEDAGAPINDPSCYLNPSVFEVGTSPPTKV